MLAVVFGIMKSLQKPAELCSDSAVTHTILKAQLTWHQ